MPNQIRDDEDIVGVRLHTRAPVTLPWLARSVVPVARALHEDGQLGVQLRRGWLHGAHVDVLARAAMGRVPDWTGIAAGSGRRPARPAAGGQRGGLPDPGAGVRPA